MPRSHYEKNQHDFSLKQSKASSEIQKSLQHSWDMLPKAKAEKRHAPKQAKAAAPIEEYRHEEPIRIARARRGKRSVGWLSGLMMLMLSKRVAAAVAEDLQATPNSHTRAEEDFGISGLSLPNPFPWEIENVQASTLPREMPDKHTSLKDTHLDVAPPHTEISQFIEIQAEKGMALLRKQEGGYYEKGSILNTVRAEIYGMMKNHNTVSISLFEHQLHLKMGRGERTFSLTPKIKDTDKKYHILSGIEKVIQQFNQQYERLVQETHRDSDIAYIEMLSFRVSSYVRSFPETRTFMFEHERAITSTAANTRPWEEDKERLQGIYDKYDNTPRAVLIERFKNAIALLENANDTVSLQRRNSLISNEELTLMVGDVAVIIGVNGDLRSALGENSYVEDGITLASLKTMQISIVLAKVLAEFQGIFIKLPDDLKSRDNFVDLLKVELQEIASCYSGMQDFISSEAGYPKAFLVEDAYSRFTKEQFLEEQKPLMDKNARVNKARIEHITALQEGSVFEIAIDGHQHKETRLLQLKIEEGGVLCVVIDQENGEPLKPFIGNGTLQKVVEVFSKQYKRYAPQEIKNDSLYFVDALLQRIKGHIRAYPGWEGSHYRYELHTIEDVARQYETTLMSKGAKEILFKYNGINAEAFAGHIIAQIHERDITDVLESFPKIGKVTIGKISLVFSDEVIESPKLEIGNSTVLGEEELLWQEIYAGVTRIAVFFKTVMQHIPDHLHAMHTARKLYFSHIREYVHAFPQHEHAEFTYEALSAEQELSMLQKHAKQPERTGSKEKRGIISNIMYYQVYVVVPGALLLCAALFGLIRQVYKDARKRREQKEDILNAYLDTCMQVTKLQNAPEGTYTVSIAKYLEVTPGRNAFLPTDEATHCTLSKENVDALRKKWLEASKAVTREKRKEVWRRYAALEATGFSSVIKRSAPFGLYLAWNRYEGLFNETDMQEIRTELRNLLLKTEVKDLWNTLWNSSPEGKEYHTRKLREKEQHDVLKERQNEAIKKRGIASITLKGMEPSLWQKSAEAIRQDIQKIKTYLEKAAKYRMHSAYKDAVKGSAKLSEEEEKKALSELKTHMHLANEALTALALNTEGAACAEKQLKKNDDETSLSVFEAELSLYEKEVEEIVRADRQLKAIAQAIVTKCEKLAVKVSTQEQALRNKIDNKNDNNKSQEEKAPKKLEEDDDIGIGLAEMHEKEERIARRNEFRRRRSLELEKNASKPTQTSPKETESFDGAKVFLPATKSHVLNYTSDNGIGLFAQAIFHYQKLIELQSVGQSFASNSNNSNNAEENEMPVERKLLYYAKTKHLGLWIQALSACPGTFGISHVMPHMEMKGLRCAIYHYAFLQEDIKEVDAITTLLSKYLVPVMRHLREHGGITKNDIKTEAEKNDVFEEEGKKKEKSKGREEAKKRQKLLKIDYRSNDKLHDLTRVTSTSTSKDDLVYSPEECLQEMVRCLKLLVEFSAYEGHPHYKDAMEMVMCEIGIYAKEFKQHQPKNLKGEVLYYRLPKPIQDCWAIRKESGHHFEAVLPASVATIVAIAKDPDLYAHIEGIRAEHVEVKQKSQQRQVSNDNANWQTRDQGRDSGASMGSRYQVL